jgi:two-component sensor histidine kinase
MKLFLKVFILFLFFDSFGQTDTININYTNKTEELILNNKIDSAKYYLNKVEKGAYKNVLNRIIKKEEVSYKEYYQFTSYLGNRPVVNYEKVSRYIDENVKIPEGDRFDPYYFELKWNQIYKLRDELSVEKASEKQKKMMQYVSEFDDSDDDVKLAKLKLKRHPIVMSLIENNVEKGKKIVLETIEEAKKMGSKELQVIFLYHLTDFLILEGKLQEYIDVCEESLRIEKGLKENSSYHSGIVQHLIDAYIYKGGNNERVNFLINEMYEDPQMRIQTYSLYLKLISYNKPNSIINKELFKKFEVSNAKELVDKFQILGKDLNSNDFYHILREGSRVLEANNLFKEALRVKDKSVSLTRKIYSEDLANSLASFKTEEAVKEKELEIKLQKEKTTLYSIITVLSIVLLIIALFVLLKIKKQSKELSEKNRIIKKTLKEKELLVKEVHHRVKNNFQIVSSLLELQTKGIEDEKALELANQGKNRVKSMALIHQKLYENKSGLIDFDEYIRTLIKELSSMYSSKDNVQTSVSSEDMMFDVDTAIPLGLIINEIITNSYKYAFRNDKENNLSISIHKEDNDDYKLVIEDNGPGLSNNFDVKKAKSLGLRLVNRLVKQLHGTLEQTNSKGAKFEIHFKDSSARQLVN